MAHENLADKLRNRDHLLILLGIGSAIIIWWLLHHRKSAGPTTYINNGGDVTFPGYDLPSYDPAIPNLTRQNYSISGGPDYAFTGSQYPVSIPSNDVGIENCGCGCSNIQPINLAPTPLPVLIVSSSDTPRAPVYVIQPPRPAPVAAPEAVYRPRAVMG